MGFAGLKNIFEIYLQLQLEDWLCDVIMTLKLQVEDEDERKNKIWDRKMNQSDHPVKYGHSDIFMHHDPAEIRGLVVVAPRQSQDNPIF